MAATVCVGHVARLASQFWFLFPFLVQLQDRVTVLGLGVTGPFVDEHVDENTARFNRLTALHIPSFCRIQYFPLLSAPALKKQQTKRSGKTR